MSNQQTVTHDQQEKITGVILAIISIVSIFVMLHHPTISSESIDETIREVHRESDINTLVHGVLIAFIMLINVCLSDYSKVRGLNRNSVLSGLIVYWVGTVVMALAALMSGVVGPQLAEHYHQATSNQAEIFNGIFLLTYEMNQAFAYFSVFCWCAGICFWAFDMIHQTKKIRIFGFFSLISAFAITMGLLTGWATLSSVFGTTIILIVMSCWQFGIACHLYFQTSVEV